MLPKCLAGDHPCIGPEGEHQGEREAPPDAVATQHEVHKDNCDRRKKRRRDLLHQFRHPVNMGLLPPVYVEPDNGGDIEWCHEQWCHHGIQGNKLILASVEHPIGPRLEVGDLTVSARWPVLLNNRRMSMRNQARVRVEVKCATMP